MFVAVFLHMIIVGDKASWLKQKSAKIHQYWFFVKTGFGIFFFSLSNS